MSTQLIVVTIILHFLFDWILQPRDIAKKKGLSYKGVDAVLVHMIINIVPFSVILFGILRVFGEYDASFLNSMLMYNFYSHFLIDVFLPKGKTERAIINLTAIDQILHLTILFTLLNLN